MGLIRLMMCCVWAIVCMLIPIGAFGMWGLPEIVLSGTWGQESTQFGLSKGDSLASDAWPDAIEVLSDGRVLISDIPNERTEVYKTDGSLLEVVNWSKVKRPQGGISYAMSKYSYMGDVIAFGSAGVFWTKDAVTYRKYDASFGLQETVTARPLELGRLTAKKLSVSQWHYQIEYPDGIYIYEGAKDAIKEEGLLKVNASLIVQNQKFKATAYKVSEEIPVQPNEKKKYKVAVVSEWIKPNDEFGPVRIVGVERIPTLVAQYGEAVAGPDGSIYTWMRTDSQYKILRWKWVE